MNVNDRNVVVTGSSRGIGAEIARKFADAGSRVVVSARSQDAIEALAREIEGVAIPFDANDPDDVRTYIERVESEIGAIDIFINNAGIEDGYTLADQTYESYRKTMKVNMDAPFLCSKYALSLLEKSQTARIVMITSIQGVRGYKGNISYNNEGALRKVNIKGVEKLELVSLR